MSGREVHPQAVLDVRAARCHDPLASPTSLRAGRLTARPRRETAAMRVHITRPPEEAGPLLMVPPEMRATLPARTVGHIIVSVIMGRYAFEAGRRRWRFLCARARAAARSVTAAARVSRSPTAVTMLIQGCTGAAPIAGWWSGAAAPC
jgi:hypothetical protein